jgi:capsular polysaccharide biosynthesis protein
MQMQLADVPYSMLWHLKRMPERAVASGMPPALLGWRWRARERLDAYLGRTGQRCAKVIIRPASTSSFALPRNISSRAELSCDGALWGYSQHDVPERAVSETYFARIKDARLLFFRTPDKRDFFPAIITRDGTSLECREISHRAGHAPQAAMTGDRVQHYARATWMLERAYHNHSHWLTAHLPKLLLLKERAMLSHVLMPLHYSGVMEASMRMIGIDPEAFLRFDPDRPVHVDELTLVGTDRFDPAHMREVRAAFADSDLAARAPDRRIFISRERSRGRRITNERDLWAMLHRRGFEKVFMEDLPFPAQVRMMQQARILLAPHGAGLTNMLFCPVGSHVVEIADPGFPNPNFYALAAGLGLGYWLLNAQAGKADHPLDRDLTVDVAGVEEVLERIG